MWSRFSWSRSGTARSPRTAGCASPGSCGYAPTRTPRKPAMTRPASDRVWVHIAGRELELSNLDKVMYPESGFTKGEVIDYYVRMADVLLPHLRDRPLTRIR